MDIPAELVTAAQAGDRHALEELISRSYRPAYALALRLLKDPDDAAEATQEAYVRVMKSLKGFREPAAFPTWLFRIVSNQCMSELRRRGRREVPSEIEEDATPRSDLRPVETEDDALGRVFRDEVERSIAALPDSYRTVVLLRDVYDLPADEVAEMLGVTPGALKVRLHRARRRVRDDLVRRFPDWARSTGRSNGRETA